MSTKTFNLFDPTIEFEETQQAYQIRRCTDHNINRVCQIHMDCRDLDHAERAYYAAFHSRYQPKQVKKNEYDFTFENIIEKRFLHAFIAQALFYEFPELVVVNDNKVVIKNEELLDYLDRAAVSQALSFFLTSFSVMPFSARLLDSVLGIGQNIAGLQMPMLSTEERKQSGAPTSSKSTKGRTTTS